MNVKNVARICPICSSAHGKIIHHQKFSVPSNYRLPREYDVISCMDCNFVYADTPAIQVDYDDYYESYSKYEEKSSTGSGTTYLDMKRLEQTATDIHMYLNNPQAKILDIGSGNGGLLSALHKLGYRNLTGMDPSIVSAEYIKNQLNFSAIHGGIFNAEIFYDVSEEGKYDCIILSHVLEHICDLNGAITNIVKLLKREGILYLEVPDASRYHDYYVVPYYYFDCEHINHFDEVSLTNLMKRVDFNCVSYSKKELVFSETNHCPAVFGLYSRSLPAIDLDSNFLAVEKSVLKYCMMSQSTSQIFDLLIPIVESQEPVIVWGAGSYTQRILGTTRLHECNLLGFVDRDSKKHGLSLGGGLVHEPDFLNGFTGTIVVCSALHSKEIEQEIRGLGLENKVILLNPEWKE